jgi:tetratricopeptide (TPR) repeat protein
MKKYIKIIILIFILFICIEGFFLICDRQKDDEKQKKSEKASRMALSTHLYSRPNLPDSIYKNQIEKLNEAQKIDSTEPSIYGFKASMYKYLRDYQEAFNNINIALKLMPNYYGYYHFKGSLFDIQSNNDSAFYYYHKALYYINYDLNHYPPYKGINYYYARIHLYKLLNLQDSAIFYYNDLISSKNFRFVDTNRLKEVIYHFDRQKYLKKF